MSYFFPSIQQALTWQKGDQNFDQGLERTGVSFFVEEKHTSSALPIESMYGIFTFIWLF